MTYDVFFHYTESQIDISDTVEMTEIERDRLDVFLEMLQDQGVIDYYEIDGRSESVTPFAGFVEFLQSETAIDLALSNSSALTAYMTTLQETMPERRGDPDDQGRPERRL